MCDENIMFWEVSGIGTEVIGLLWNLPFLEYFTGLFFLGLFLSLIVPSGSLLFSVSCFLSLVYLTLSWSSLLFLSLVPDCVSVSKFLFQNVRISGYVNTE